VAAAAITLVAPATAASAGDQGGGGDVHVAAAKLSGPRQLNSYTHGKLVVAENDSGEVSSIDARTGKVRTLLSKLPFPQGVDYDDGRLFVALGEAPPDAPPPPAGSTTAPGATASSLVVAKPGGKIVKRYDLLAYELKHNPDGQKQFADDGKTPLDALSNPFAVHVQEHRILVADAGANDVLSIDRHSGRIHTFFVPPRVSPKEVPACAGANDAQGVQGCDPVPTGVTQGKHGLIYVSTLGAEVPGAGRVYVLNKHGKVLRVIKKLTGPTGIAVDSRGAINVSEVLEGAPEGDGPPPPNFDASAVGQIIRIAPNGTRTYAQVTMPTGLEFRNGRLYASAWSVAIFLNMPDAGQVVTVPRGMFTS
jgi:DNA-binding beta-propeller fold protein YncE